MSNAIILVVCVAVLFIALCTILYFRYSEKLKEEYYRGYYEGIDDMCAYLNAVEINVNESEVKKNVRH